MNWTDYIIPTIILLILVAATVKNMPSYNFFIEGAKGAIDLCIAIFPYIAAIMAAVSLLRISGITNYLTVFLSPFFSFFGIPHEIAEFALLRPFSGSGSLALLTDIITKYGADSYAARSASVIMGSTETVFYVAAVYTAGGKIKKLRFTLAVALISCFISVVVACFLTRFI